MASGTVRHDVMDHVPIARVPVYSNCPQDQYGQEYQTSFRTKSTTGDQVRSSDCLADQLVMVLAADGEAKKGAFEKIPPQVQSDR